MKQNLNVIVIGNGDKIINQYPSINTTVVENDIVILKTNDIAKKVPSFINLSYKESKELCKMLDIECIYEGNGYTIKQDIEENTEITENMTIKLTLE